MQFFPLIVTIQSTGFSIIVLKGLWGERLFDKFDQHNMGKIDFIEFLQGISYCCKCDDEQKTKILFHLYDKDHDGYLEERDILAMVSESCCKGIHAILLAV